jgi:hypothetical protein
MITRRLAQSLRDQNWTTITIEFVLLVIGVFLGIQAANWNAQRADDERARAYLTRIRGNLLTDQVSIQRRVDFWNVVIAEGKAAIRYAETGELVDGSAWKTVRAFYQASQLWQWVPADATYQEMRSGGELGLIRDEVLRESLSQYYLESGSGVAYVFAVQPEYRKLVRGLTPSVVADHIWANCWSQPSPFEQLLLDCDSPISEAQAQAVLDGYLAEPRLLPELRFWVASEGVAIAVIGNSKAALDGMLARERTDATKNGVRAR